jgi:hypothetical protein
MDLFVGEFGVVNGFIVNLVNHSQRFGLGRKTAAEFLNGPGFALTSGFP